MDKSGIMLGIIVEKMKKNQLLFGDLTVKKEQKEGNTYADITLKIGNDSEKYQIVITKKAG